MKVVIRLQLLFFRKKLKNAKQNPISGTLKGVLLGCKNKDGQKISAHGG
jgi:hypothetical protein